MGSLSEPVSTSADIIDIRSDTSGIELKQLIIDGIKPARGTERTLPTLLLYDEPGLKLFEDITYLEEYYLTETEIAVLREHADEIAKRLPHNAMVVELGSGNLRKIKILLDALDRAGKATSYYALDLMQTELERTLAAVPKGTFKNVQCFGLLGTYDDGLKWLKRAENETRQKVILSMGSSIGNFNRQEASSFLAQFAAVLGPQDKLLVGIDACQDAPKVFQAYNDRAGVTRNFTLNGLKHANKLLGYEAFVLDEWDAVGEYDEASGGHRAYVVPKQNLQVEGVAFRQGERIRIEESNKYNRSQQLHLFSDSDVIELDAFTNNGRSYGLHLLQKVSRMSMNPESYAAHPVPGLSEWHELWSKWDNVTRQMIPGAELLEKPIKLRNACIFYLGHIPTFFDMKIVEATGLAPTEPSSFHRIFERGIDPDVDDPEKCHAHSEIPDAWPDLDTILDYQERVRHRVHELYRSGRAYTDNWAGRALWLGFEHEVMHLETLLYMLVQSEKTLPPSGTAQPDFKQIATQAEVKAVANKWFDIPAQSVKIGLNDPDSGDGPVRYFGWDVEKPEQVIHVPSFRAQGRPITNGEYAQYLLDIKSTSTPASWTTNATLNDLDGNSDGHTALMDYVRGKAVRTVYGLVPLELAIDWPVSASYDELQGCAKYLGGRIPTMEEARSIYQYAELLRKKLQPPKTTKTIPAVNGHLINEGVQESPPSKASTSASSGAVAGLDPNELYIDLEGANVGFKHWHPMPVTAHGDRLAGQGGMGGVWEWTSSPLKERDGYQPMKLYPAYSADFYDGKHNIVLGGSWATHPRFAGRKSVVNWYQRNYPYVWAGARLVKDL